MVQVSLADSVKRNFSKIRLKKVSVKVPKLKARKRREAGTAKGEKIPVSSIINILIKASIENAKREKEKKPVSENKKYTIKDENLGLDAPSGYGAISKGYGTAPHTSYVDYGKLFSYLGKFKSQSAYENMGNHVEFLNKSAESGSFVLADKDSMDKIGRFDKYMKSPVTAIQTMALSLVPIAGLSSGEWEEIKNLMKFDPVLYTLKSKTS